MDCKCNACGQFTAACRCSDAAAEVQARLDAQAAQDAADLEAGRALRELRKVYPDSAVYHKGDCYEAYWWVGGDESTTRYTSAPTLPAAVAAALDG